MLTSAQTTAADLSKVERTIRKEPNYRTKPKYCLLVFGPQANTRVWVVLDGDTLYVDRNGNGDLTDDGEPVAGKKSDLHNDEYTFKVGDIRDGARLHKEFRVHVSNLKRLADLSESVEAFVAKNPKAQGFNIAVEVEIPGWKGSAAGGRVEQHTFLLDVNGVLQFADKPAEAPILHFGGPWQITFFSSRPRLVIGRESDTILAVGTPGVGPGSTTWVEYDVIPEKLFPTVEVTYPAKRAGDAPIRERYELKKRC